MHSTLFCISVKSNFVPYNTFTETYRSLALEYMRVIEILNFECQNQIFSNSIIMFSFLQLQFSLLNQCSNNADSEYPITLLRHKPH